ncbi:ABC transporter permease [Edaphobacter aggregans]|uniref:ABC transporter permease n=1 Tax=Edaphobacter aggregans TaxID=570835 RepID=UPI0005587F17|nr:ABC transporter permease [Edaphobacter aggregans]
MFYELLTRLRYLVRSKPRHEIDEELQFHLEQQTAAYRAAGMTQQESRRQAVIAFGGTEAIREQTYEQRPAYLFDTAMQDIRYSLRGFGRNPLFTSVMVLTLMLGIGATTAVFSVVDRVLFRPLPYAHSDQLASVGLVQALETQEFMTSGFYYDWRDGQKAFQSMTSEEAATHKCDLTEGSPEQLDCESIEGNFLSTLGVKPSIGRNFLPEETRPGGPRVAIISYAFWLNHYGLDPGILSKPIDIDQSRVQVIGVLPQNFEMPRLQPVEVLFPITVDEASDRTSNGGFGSARRVFGRLNPGVSLEQANVDLQPLFRKTQAQLPPTIRYDFHLKLRSLRDGQMQGVRKIAWVLFGAVLTVLLIACTNVASLLMARGAARQRELAVRSALGASRTRLIRQAITESLLLSGMGAIAGCALAAGLLHIFVALAPVTIPYLSQIHLDLRIISFTIVLSILCGLFFSIFPAVQKPANGSLNGRSSLNASHATTRKWLVITQIAASMVLLAGATLLFRSFRNLETQHLGMTVDNSLTANINLGEHSYASSASKVDFCQRLMTRLRFLPGVSLVSISDSIPPGAGVFRGRFDEIAVDGRPLSAPGTGGIVGSRRVSPDYFRAFDIPILQGRTFHDQDQNSSEHPIIISERLAKLLFPNKDPLGQRLRFDRLLFSQSWSTVTGVAADVKNSGLTSEEIPEYYRPWSGGGTSVFVVKSSLPADQTSRLIRTQVAALDPTVPVTISTVRQAVSKLADQPRFQAVLVGFFAAIGVTLSLIGLYGVISFLVAQRTQEIGVRLALGANKSTILGLVMGQSFKLIAVGVAIGLIVAFALTRALASLLYGIGSHDPITFAFTALVLVLVGLGATLIPARSATEISPAVALRCE